MHWSALLNVFIEVDCVKKGNATFVCAIERKPLPASLLSRPCVYIGQGTRLPHDLWKGILLSVYLFKMANP